MATPFSKFDELPVLETERLRLRALGPTDAEALYEVFSDPEVMRYWSNPPHPDLERTKTMIEDIRTAVAEGEILQWGIERREDGRLLGTVTLISDGSQPRAELGYILGREHWGQGYAGEAQRSAVGFAFDDLGLHRLEADTDPDNTASLRSLERLGFRREGTLRERWIVGDRVSDSAILGLLAREWRDA